MKLNILAFGAHPDDVELGCSGTLINLIAKGYTVGIIDLTRGELGSRGTASIRDIESTDAQKIIGAIVRENVHLCDGFIKNDDSSQKKIVEIIRRYQPDIIFCNAIYDRHPDHGHSSQLVEDAAFFSGLTKIETSFADKKQSVWRPRLVLHYVQDRFIQPHIITDISQEWGKKMASIQAHKSQFYDPDSTDPQTYISSPEFWTNIESRAKEFGRTCGFKYGEGFTCSRTIGSKDAMQLF